MEFIEAYDGFAAYYDASGYDRRTELGFYKSFVSSRHRAFLELGCGTGTILGQLAIEMGVQHRSGWRVVGVDVSRPMLELASARYPEFDWLHGDMCNPPVSGSFDLVLCPFNSLQQLDSQEAFAATLRAACDSLKDGGLFIFDIYNDSYAPPASSAIPSTEDHLVRSFVDAGGRNLEVRETVHHAPGGEFALIDWRIVNPVRPGENVATLRLKYRTYSAETVEALVCSAGLTIVERFGDIRKSPFSASNSKKHIVVCRRRDTPRVPPQSHS